MKVERIKNTTAVWVKDVDYLVSGKIYVARRKDSDIQLDNCAGSTIVFVIYKNVYILFDDELLPVVNPHEYEYRLVTMVDIKYRFTHIVGR